MPADNATATMADASAAIEPSRKIAGYVAASALECRRGR